MFSSQFIQLYIVLSDINVRNFLVFSYIFASQFTHFCHKFIYICTSQFTHFLTNSSQHYTQFSTLLFVYFSTLLESILKSGLLSSALLAGKNLVGIVGVGIVGVGIIAPTPYKDIKQVGNLSLLKQMEARDNSNMVLFV